MHWAKELSEADKKPFAESGVYLWTVPVSGRLYVHCVGEAKPFSDRLRQHLSYLESGQGYIYDPAMLQAGFLRVVHKSSAPCEDEVFRKAVAADYSRLVRFFLLPLPTEGEDSGKTLRQRVEAALAYGLSADPETSRVLDQSWQNLHGRLPGDPEIAVYGEQSEPIVGVPSVIWA